MQDTVKLLILTLVVALGLSGTHASWAGDTPPPSESYTFLRNLDFSSALAALPHKGFTDFSPTKRMDHLVSHKVTLTDAEDRLLAGYHLTDGAIDEDLYEALEDACYFYSRYGRLPKDGVELFADYSDFKFFPHIAGASWDDKSLTPAQRLGAFPMVFKILNPAQGRVISTFQDSHGSPFGIDLEPMANQEKGGANLPPKWHLVVYGQEPGRRIIDTVLKIGSHEKEEKGYDNKSCC